MPILSYYCKGASHPGENAPARAESMSLTSLRRANWGVLGGHAVALELAQKAGCKGLSGRTSLGRTCDKTRTRGPERRRQLANNKCHIH